MYSEFDYFSFLAGMSNSEFFLVKEDKQEIEFEVSSRPTLEFPDGFQVTASNNDPELQKHQQEEKCEVNTESSKELKTPLLGEIEVADDDDGFTTPTSSDHKIPVIKQCPPAPQKLRPQQSTTKRKSPPKLRPNILQLDLSKEVESMFPPTLQDDIGRKIKKARRDDKE
uniref:Cyclin-dependent protein kinase inhibitor SMR3-like n=1 Tax=Davidia involucrata TaxID=16924 RepID=A0A5B6YW82_DAVIN